LIGGAIDSERITGHDDQVTPGTSSQPFHALQPAVAENAPVTAGISATDLPIEKNARSRPPLVAPLWHTALVLFLLLAPSAFWRPLVRMLPSHDHASRGLIYTMQLEFQWIFFLIVLLGLIARKTQVRDLIGAGWRSWRDFFRYTKLGIEVMVLNVLVAIFLVLILHPGRSAPDSLFPHRKADLPVFFLIACTAGFTEEVIFRGYLQRQFHALLRSPWAAFILQAAVFSLAHGYHESTTSLIAKFIGGLAFGYLAIQQRSLLPGILGHSCQDCLVGILSVLFFPE
jgi:membrane protease YdiL (CAAX protease family)